MLWVIFTQRFACTTNCDGNRKSKLQYQYVILPFYLIFTGFSFYHLFFFRRSKRIDPFDLRVVHLCQTCSCGLFPPSLPSSTLSRLSCLRALISQEEQEGTPALTDMRTSHGLTSQQSKTQVGEVFLVSVGSDLYAITCTCF